MSISLTIEKLVHGGSGVGTSDGMKVFVPYSAPGDVLDVEITADHKNFAEGQIVSIIEPSPCRTEPRCHVFGSCGGCQWQHLSYDAQLEWKRLILKESLERIGKIENPEMLPTLASPAQWNYRNRIQLHVDSNGRVGYYRPKSKEVVEFARCLIAEEKINDMLCSERAKLRGRDRGIAFRLEDGFSFSQINSGQNEQMRGILCDWLSKIPHDNVLELYAGAGNFTFAMAGICGRIVASDVDGRAIEAAKERQSKEGVWNIEFVRAASAKAAGYMGGVCDVVIVDPPRKGCAEAIGDISKLDPRAIIYISCDPATLARDLHDFIGHGYRLERTLPVDMFPQTFHVESMTMMGKR